MLFLDMKLKTWIRTKCLNATEMVVAESLKKPPVAGEVRKIRGHG
jgi:hypothetical protein